MKFVLLCICFLYFNSCLLYGMRPSPSKLEPSWGALPVDVQKIIQSYLSSSIVADSLQQTVENITNFALINRSFRDFLNNPKNLIYVIQMMADRIHRIDENSVARGLKNMPGMQNSEVTQWLKMKDEERKLGGELIVALQGGEDGEAIRKILAKKANPNYKQRKDKMPALVFATFMNNLEAVQELLKAGAQVNATDLKLRTALNWATTNQNLPILEELLKHHANVNAQDENGDTALMGLVAVAILAHESNLAIIRALLDAGTDLSIRNKQGKNALDLVHNDEIKALLLSKQK